MTLLDKRILHTGTTTVGLVTGEFAVLAADKRATAGFMIASRRVKKIVKLTDYAVMTMAGLVADAQMLADILESQARLYELDTGAKMGVRSIAVLLSNILFSYKAFPFIIQALIGGYDTQPRLYVLDLFGSITEEKFAATGSGSPIAYGVLEQHYREDMSLEEAVRVATAAVRTATLRDAASGDGVDVAIIGEKGIEERFISFAEITI